MRRCLPMRWSRSRPSIRRGLLLLRVPVTRVLTGGFPAASKHAGPTLAGWLLARSISLSQLVLRLAFLAFCLLLHGDVRSGLIAAPMASTTQRQRRSPATVLVRRIAQQSTRTSANVRLVSWKSARSALLRLSPAKPASFTAQRLRVLSVPVQPSLSQAQPPSPSRFLVALTIAGSLAVRCALSVA